MPRPARKNAEPIRTLFFPRWAMAAALCAALWQGCGGDVDEGSPAKQAGSGGGGKSGQAAGASGHGGRSGAGANVGGTGAGGSAGKAGAAGTNGGGGVHPDGFYRMEALDRGLVAVQTDDGVYLGWRMFGFEYDRDNPERVTYRVYRDGSMIAEVGGSTNHQDADGEASSSYTVAVVIDGDEGPASAAVTPWASNYLRVPLDPPSSMHNANDASAADLDGDGQYELILKWDPADAKDNSQEGVTSSVYLDGLELDGTRRFRIDLGPNIRAGAHYTQFIVYDFDGDGKAELAVKTAPGTRDSTGAYLSDGPAADDDDSQVYRNADGYVLTGPEYLSVFSGETGAELATVNFDVPRGTVADWGDNYGNRVDRFLATAAYLDDTGLPSFVMARGYYTRTTLTAWNFRDGALSQLWKFDSDQTPEDAQGHRFTGQGTHSIGVANTDDDKPQEIVYGAMTIDNDGRGKCSTGLGHGDALHVSDFVPDRPGLESFMPHENKATPYWSLRDADNCEILRQGMITDDDIGRGVAADVLPGSPGAEMWSAGGIPLLRASDGSEVGAAPGSINFVIWWDGDESRELENGTAISKYGGGTLQQCDACMSNNGTKSTPTLTADLLGDWREEVIWREADNRGLRLYTTTLPTQRRIYTLMHDPQYRIAISWQNVAYNQPPHPSFHIGEGMAAPPQPDIRTGE